jgi:hypothetical protein
MEPKKNRKQAQETMLEKPIENRGVPLESTREEEPITREDQDEPKSEQEQQSSILFTPEQLEVLLKMNRLDLSELVAAFLVIQKCGIPTGQTREFRWCPRPKVVDAWFAEMEDYIHATKVGQHSIVELTQSYLKGYVVTW